MIQELFLFWCFQIQSQTFLLQLHNCSSKFEIWNDNNKKQEAETKCVLSPSFRGGAYVKFNTKVGMFNLTNPVVITSFPSFSSKKYLKFVVMLQPLHYGQKWIFNSIFDAKVNASILSKPFLQNYWTFWIYILVA